MMRLLAGLFLAAAVWAQSFTPKMPDTVPPVGGPVVEAAALRYIEIQAGTGEPAKAGREYTVHYTGWLRDGAQFDSSVGKEPLTFVQGRRLVIAGFDVGFEGMRVGGKRRLFIPYQFAYGEQGRGSIPPKAELIFDVELLAVKDAAPAPPAAADLLLPFREIRERVLALAQAVPQEKYAWRPAAGVRSFQEVFLHIAFANELLLRISRNAKPEDVQAQMEANTKGETEPLAKAQVIAKLTASFEAVRQALENARPNNLSREVRFFDTPATARGVLAYLDVHIGEHLGQAIAYARMNGIVPPWSK
jgi:peptidylprolyl isomerase